MFKNNFLVNLFVGFVKITGNFPVLLLFKPRVIKTLQKTAEALYNRF